MADLNVSSSTVIDAPAATIFAILADPRQHARIDGSGTVRGVVKGPDRLTLGDTFGMDMKLGAPYKIRNKVVEYDADRLIAWRHVGRHRWRYELEPTGAPGQTKVTETWDVSYYGPFNRVLHAIFGAKFAEAIPATLAKLKTAAEADSSDGDGTAR